MCYAQIFGPVAFLGRGGGEGGGGGETDSDWGTRNFVTHVIVEKKCVIFSRHKRERGREGGREEGGGGGGGLR